jgi:penicillin-binding protein 2
VTNGFADLEPPLPGLRIVSKMGRDYPFPSSASHLIGWLGRLSAKVDRSTALALGLDPQGWSGTRGLEGRYDELLQGVVGRQVRLRTPTGWQVIEHEQRDPVPGTDLATTLDLELQLAVEDALARWLQLADDLGTIPARHRDEVMAAQAIGKGRAGMCVIDVHSGAILALASTPGFDLTEVRTRYGELIDPELSPGQPLHDNATWAAQPPGSTVKPLVAFAAMAEGVLRPGEVVHTEGYMARWRGRGILGDHPPVPHDWTVSEAITRSSNTYFATMGERLGPHKLVAWMRRFGLGTRNAVDVDWQRPGLLPSPDTIMRTRPTEPVWLPADTWRLGIGQFCTASPLQIAPIAACVANGGTILRPYLWRGQAENAVAEVLDLSPEAVRVVRQGMIDVTETGGTAPWLQLRGEAAGVQVAAKTGTSEWGSRDSRRAGLTPDNGWLMGYAPATEPKVAFAIYVHASGMSGGRACSGVAVQVLQTYFTQLARERAVRLQPDTPPSPR